MHGLYDATHATRRLCFSRFAFCGSFFFFSFSVGLENAFRCYGIELLHRLIELSRGRITPPFSFFLGRRGYVPRKGMRGVMNFFFSFFGSFDDSGRFFGGGFVLGLLMAIGLHMRICMAMALA